MIVKAFRGLRPRPDLASKVPSHPYDVLSSAEARELAGDDPDSFLHVIKPEIDLNADISPYDDRVYAKGRENLRRMIDDGRMVRDETPAYYVYRLTMDGHTQTGIVGAAAVVDYVEDRIKKHEHTRPKKEEDRIRLNEALGAHPGPVLLAYRAVPQLSSVVEQVTSADPRVRFIAADGVEHVLWVVDDPGLCASIETAFQALPCTYIADGHHRSAAAAKVGERLDESVGPEPRGHFLAVHFPSDELRVLDYNRVVHDLNGHTPAALLERLEQAGFRVTPDHPGGKPTRRGEFGMYLDGRWYLLGAGDEQVPTQDVVDRLDVSVLTRRILEPILGIGDLRKDERIDFVGGIRGMKALEERVDNGEWAVAFSLYPTSLEEVMQVADAGDVMPPKSTWFEPKLRSGMVVQLLEGQRL